MIIQFGEGRVLVWRFAQDNEAGVVLQQAKERIREIPVVQTRYVSDEVLSQEGIVLRFSSVSSVDGLLEDLLEVREALRIVEDACKHEETECINDALVCKICKRVLHEPSKGPDVCR